MTYSALLRCCVLALTLTVGVAGCAVVSGQETTGEYIDDATITTKVKASIVDRMGLQGIGVETMQSVVQLSGFVKSDAIKAEAGQIARTTSGVKGVRNDLVVQ